MRIGINLLYLLPGMVGGTETYALSLLRALSTIDSRNLYYVFVNIESAQLRIPEAINFHRIVCQVRASRRSLRYAWEQLVLPLKMKELGIDVVHSLGYVGPLEAGRASVVTIHDMNVHALEATLPLLRRTFLRSFIQLSARHSTHIITVSHFSKAEIQRWLGVREDKITVTHEGPGRPGFRELRKSWPEVAQVFGLRKPYMVAFSSQSPHKNIARLLHAFTGISQRIPHSLVLIGHPPSNVSLKELLRDLGLERKVVITEYVPDDIASVIVSNAALFLFPSWYEGFGLPILEAQSAGVPVACSRAGSIPEVAGEGAIYFDAASTEGMASCIEQCLANPEHLESLRGKGFSNVGRFSWEKTARETLDVYDKIGVR